MGVDKIKLYIGFAMKEIITHIVRRFYPYQPLLWIRGKLIIRKQNDDPSEEEIYCYY